MSELIGLSLQSYLMDGVKQAAIEEGFSMDQIVEHRVDEGGQFHEIFNTQPAVTFQGLIVGFVHEITELDHQGLARGFEQILQAGIGGIVVLCPRESVAKTGRGFRQFRNYGSRFVIWATPTSTPRVLNSILGRPPL